MKFQKSKLLLVVCLVFVLMSSMLVGCGSSGSSTSSPDSSVATPTGPVTPAAGTKAFESTEYGITFNYPESWKLEKGTDSILCMYTTDATEKKDFYTFNVVANESSEKVDVSGLGKQMEEQYKNQLQNFKVSSNKDTKVSGCDGVRMEYTGEMSGLKMKCLTLAFAKDKKAFVVTVFGSETGYDKNASALESLLKTVYVK